MEGSSSILGTALNPVYDTLSIAQTVATTVIVILLAIIIGVVIFLIKMEKRKKK